MNLPLQKDAALRLGSGGRFSQLRCGISIFNNPITQKATTSQYAIVYLLEGTGTYISGNNKKYKLYPGTFFQRFPNVTHTVNISSPGTICFVAVPQQIFEVFKLTLLANQNKPVYEIGIHSEIIKEFQQITKELKSCPDNKLMLCLTRMQKLIANMLLMTKQLPVDTHADIIEQACTILGNNFNTKITLDSAAQELGLSVSGFRKIFTEQMGVAPGEYRIRRRIENAMQMLSSSTMHLKEIAQELGYIDVYAFCTQFKKFSGMSPGKFRKQSE